MLICHEVPLFFLKDSFKFNDYDYLLPVFWKYPEYREHFIEARKKDRFIILDNGLFEGKVEGVERLLEIAEIIQPDVIIPPDVWNDSKLTWRNYQEWKKIIAPEKLMVVLQAETAKEASHLYYRLVDDGIKYVGFNHLGKFYDDLSLHPRTALRKTLGRVNFINSLDLNDNVHHHLLGTNIGSEFIFYANNRHINSLDTSNPITLAFEDKLYSNNAIIDKPQTTIEDIIEFNIRNEKDAATAVKIWNNINYFREHFIEIL